MGIQGLLPQLKSIMRPIGMEELKGQRVAVDTYSWLHKGVLSCSLQLCKAIPTSRHIDYCMHRVNLLRHHGIRPVLVFDGGLLPMKIEQENKRARTRKENLERALEHEAAGNSAAAYECFQKSVDVSPAMAFELIQVLKQENVDYIVAPYEADAQMAFLSLKKHVDVVITEDSDMIPFGCSRIVFKMDKYGQGVEFRSSMLRQNKGLDFSGFDKQMLLEMCILSGCDYLQSLPGMGLKRAHALLRKFKSYDKVIKHLRYSAVSVPPLYEENFKKAMWTFQHQRVYDPTSEDISHLTQIPHDLGCDLDFLGPWIPQGCAQGIAKGDLDPFTKMPFQCGSIDKVDVLNKTYSVKEFRPEKERQKLDLPAQKNVLTNYFCLASLEAKRKFKAPRTTPKTAVQMEESSLTGGHFSNTSCSAEDAVAFTTDCFQGSSLDFGKFDNALPSCDSAGSESKPVMDLPCRGNSNSPEICVPLKQPIREVQQRVLTSSEREYSYAINELDHKTRLAERKVIVRSSYFQNKVADKSKLNKEKEMLGIDREETNCFSNDGRGSINSSSGKTHHHANAIQKRKFLHDQNMQKENMPSKRMRPVETTSNKRNDVVKDTSESACTEMGKDEKFGCDISHLNRYSCMAEKSIERFVSVISAFRCTSGSRASGLRAPLKNVNNTCSIRSPKMDLSKFAYVPDQRTALASKVD
ncbi:Exonuclease 1 [Acorus gramineus]|uniref:Exonuclease 1 n=1 Tax=Acorus gramineus TaxID=55184 RepID=A0AAV9BGW0_ACOGR|nr:Exonuclease 1 [Acorus gramineus]